MRDVLVPKSGLTAHRNFDVLVALVLFAYEYRPDPRYFNQPFRRVKLFYFHSFYQNLEHGISPTKRGNTASGHKTHIMRGEMVSVSSNRTKTLPKETAE